MICRFRNTKYKSNFEDLALRGVTYRFFPMFGQRQMLNSFRCSVCQQFGYGAVKTESKNVRGGKVVKAWLI
jgi:hypothetical protein